MLLLWMMVMVWQLPLSTGKNAPVSTSDNQEILLIEAIQQISEKYQVLFNYDRSIVSNVTVDYDPSISNNVDEAISLVLKDTDLKYHMFNQRYVVIYKNDEEGIESLKEMIRHFQEIVDYREDERSKKRVISPAPKLRSIGLGDRLRAKKVVLDIVGTVKDQNGDPLIGVNVLVKGTDKGTATDFNGQFSVPDVDDNDVLVFSYIGYKTQEVAVGGKQELTITLLEDSETLDEVVVVGYGTQKKVNLTGAVGMVTAERLENRPITSTATGLQGVIPNLNIAIRGGDPTRRSNYNIRGFTSINGGEPLILVDGVPMELDGINPNDIESVNVLKDAAAAAIYGARAAFGVILVQTKKGKKGLNVNLGSEYGLSTPIMNVDQIADPYIYATVMNDVYLDNTGQVRYSDEQIANLKRYHDNPIPENEWAVKNGVLEYYGVPDIQDYVVTDFAPQQKYDLSVSGASDKTSFYASFGYLDKKGYLKNKDDNQDYDRYNILMKADFNLAEWLDIDSKLVLNAETNDQPHDYGNARSLNTIIRYNPVDNPILFPDLPYYLTPGDHDQFEQYVDMYFDGSRMAPYADLGGRDLFEKYDTWLSQGVTVSPLEGLKIRANYSQQIYYQMNEDQQTRVPTLNKNLQNLQILYSQSSNDYISNESRLNKYNVINAYAEYTLTKNNDHYLKVMGGFNQEWGRNQMIKAQAYTLNSPTIIDLSATSGTQQTDGSKTHVALRGAFYRFNYIYKDKYLFEANGRYDLSSRFPEYSRSGFFPSFSVGWRLSNEGFMDATNSWLDNLKIRASYGTLGNQLLGNNYYPYISNIGLGQREFVFGSGLIPYASPAGLVSSQLTWETVTSKNIGLDISLFGARLDLSADAYIRETKDMLMDASYPAILGANGPKANAADLETKGWEVSLTWRDKIGEDWDYRFFLALSDNQSEITKYDNPTGAFEDYYVGKEIGEIWGFETVGLFQSDSEAAEAPDQSQLGSGWGAGDVQYADLNGDGVISYGSNTLSDPGDRKVIGNTTARYSFGITPEISYKNWSMNLFFQGYLRRHYYPNPTQRHVDFFPFNTDSFEKWWVEESWSEDNPDAYWPRPRYMRISNTRQNFYEQTRFLQNVGYIRLKTVSLSYNLPQQLVNKAGISRAQVYLTGMNLWEATKALKSIDPEYIYTTFQEYYLQRTYALGVKASF